MDNILYKVCEIFVSINGEGPSAGFPAVFVRFAGCNLSCSYCDTRWANEKDVPARLMTSEEIVSEVRKSGITRVTLTGGEPLLREGITELIDALHNIPDMDIEIETNGSIDVKDLDGYKNRPAFIMDYKLPGSGMEEAMCVTNFSLLGPRDAVKFVAGSHEDLHTAHEIIQKYRLSGCTQIFFSPVFGEIDPKDIVDFLIRNRINGARLQLQMHKFIWDPMQRGV